MTDEPQFKLTKWEAFTLNASRVNRERSAYYRAKLDALLALTAEDRCWLDSEGYEVAAAIWDAEVELMMEVTFR